MALPSKRRIKLPESLNLPGLNWETLYANLVHGKFGRGDQDGSSQLRMWAIVSALLELYDYCRTLEQEFGGLDHHDDDSAPSIRVDGEGWREEIRILQERVDALERREGVPPSPRQEALPASGTGVKRMKVLDI